MRRAEVRPGRWPAKPLGPIVFCVASLAASAAAAAGTPEVIAHRGGALLWPENTIYALEQAAKAGVEYLEFDLQLTADNELLVTHDSDINSDFCAAPAGRGLVPKPVRVLTLEQSRDFDCGSRSRKIYPDAEKRATGMSALEEVFSAFEHDTRIKYFIETKLPRNGAPGKPIDPTLYAAKLDQLVRKYGLEDRVILQSFDWRTIGAMHELNPRVRTCPLGVPRNSHDYAATLRELHAGCIVLGAEETTSAQIAQFQRDGVLVFSGVIDKEEDWRKALELGYDAIFTNDPLGVIGLLRNATPAIPTAAAASETAGQATPRAVLLISVDGLHPSYVIESQRLGVEIPALREFVEKGAYSTGVVNVTPTVTYPNHTSIVTGVAPAEHGIQTNTVFDPEGFEQGAWNWYGSQIRVPTLWDAAKAAGLTTASVLWPVSVAHPAIDYNMPEYWRTKNRASDSHLLYAVSTPRGFLETVDGADRLFDTADNEQAGAFDEKLTRIALAMIEQGRPQLLTIHLPGLDGAQHKHGPLPTNDASRQALEKIDAMIARLIQAQRAVYPDSTIVVASDHGFHPVDATVNLNAAFARAGLIELDRDGRLESWKAYSWNSGGSASVVLKDKHDAATRDAVDAILTELEQDPDSGVASVLRGAAAVKEGALAEASFLVDAKGGVAMGSALTGDTVRRQSKTTGAHGYRNTHPEMNAAFFVMGPGVQAGKNLGRIDIRQIAPTLARELGVSLPTATQAPLPLGR